MREDGTPTRIMIVEDQERHALASVMGMAGCIVHPAMLGASISRGKAGNRHEPHQGAKERAKRLKRLQRG